METSSTRLKKPLHIWVARLIGFGVVFVCMWANILLLPEYLQTIRYQGLMNDVHLRYDANGNAVTSFVSTHAKQMGILEGDKVLNPQDIYTFGEIGSPVTLYVQTGDAPLRLVILTRRPWWSNAMGPSFLGLSINTSITMAVLILVIPLIFAGVSSFLLCWLKSDDWMAILTAVAIARVVGVPGEHPFFIIFRTVTFPVMILWFVLFPNGKFLPRWVWLIPLFLQLPSVLLDAFLELGLLVNRDLESVHQTMVVLNTSASLTLLAIIAYRYKYVFSQVERQQSKWVLVPVLIGISPLVILSLLTTYYWNLGQFDKNIVAGFLFDLMYAALTLIVILGVLFSVFQYRLYDVDMFVSRAIVYSGLTGILGSVGVLLTPLIDYILKQSFGDQTGLLAVMISAFPIAALFNPVRERLQSLVDRHFKQEEFDFENSFIEFTSELSALFTVKELSTLLSRQAVEQLDVAYASVFLNGQNGDLKHIKTTAVDSETPELNLDEKTVERIKGGQLTSPEGDYSQSLVVPLVVPRSRKPSVLGALVLGPRVQGVGYSTAMVKSLKKFGEEVGKVFYAAELRSKKKRLASNE
jgi:hypothetical protein